jgi:hypothetical protein
MVVLANERLVYLDFIRTNEVLKYDKEEQKDQKEHGRESKSLPSKNPMSRS